MRPEVAPQLEPVYKLASNFYLVKLNT
jgi:hypothetical protein